MVVAIAGAADLGEPCSALLAWPDDPGRFARIPLEPRRTLHALHRQAVARIETMTTRELRDLWCRASYYR